MGGSVVLWEGMVATTYKLALLSRHFVANKAAPGESLQYEPQKLKLNVFLNFI